MVYIDLPGAKFDHCCCCLPLNVGAHIIGILAIIAAIFGVIDFIIILGYFSLLGFAYVFLTLIYLLPCVSYIMMLCDNNEHSRKTFASMYFLSCAIGLSVYLLFCIIELYFFSLLVFVLAGCIDYYFYLCLKAYALEGLIQETG